MKARIWAASAALVTASLTAPVASAKDCRASDKQVQLSQCTDQINTSVQRTDIGIGHLYRCQAYDVLGNYAEALADCIEANRLMPEDGSVHNSMSIIFQNMGRHDQAVHASVEAIDLNPDNGSYFNTRANAHCGAGNIEASMDDRMSAANKGLYTLGRIQEILKARGFYDGPITAEFGAEARAALEAWTRAGCR
ncbi:MAG: hypothetical protein AAGK00_16870 [Pseudomonadota bacterium]